MEINPILTIAMAGCGRIGVRKHHKMIGILSASLKNTSSQSPFRLERYLREMIIMRNKNVNERGTNIEEL